MKRLAKFAAGLMLASAFAVSGAVAADVKLTWQMWAGDAEDVANWQSIADMVHAKYPDITVELQTAPWGDYWTKLAVQAASNQMTDIFSLQSLRTPNFHQLMEPLNAYVERDKFPVGEFVPSIIEGMSWEGQLYGLPFDLGPPLVFYNKDRFDAAGLTPTKAWTMDDFKAAAKALTGDGKYGVGITPSMFAAWVSASGANYVAADGSYQLTDPGVVGALEDLVNMVSVDKVAPPVASASADEVNAGRFDSGEVAMQLDGPWSIISKKKSVKFTLGILPVPAASGGLSPNSGAGFGIWSGSQHKEEAWKAVQVITSPEALAVLAKSGRAFVARPSEQQFWFDVAAKDVLGAQESLTYALDNSKSFPTGANWNVLEGLFNQYLPLAFSGSETPAETLATIQDLVDQAQ
jgi:ABC-type glycerol-3-phosphate transport system substrate-binding protein